MKNVSKNIDGLGLRIAQARTKLGLSQSNISDLIGMYRPNYTAIENETNSRFLRDYQLKAIATKLNVSADYLLGLVSGPTPKADINTLGISSNSVDSINSLKSSCDSSTLHIFDDFVGSHGNEFWELLSLYKRAKSFFDEHYSFILEFTEDISPNRISVFTHTTMDLSKLESNHKYFYYDLEDARKILVAWENILNTPNSTIGECTQKLISFIKSED